MDEAMTYDELKALIEQRGVHAVFGSPGEGWAIEQSPSELATFLVAMQSLGVHTVLEIGTGWRGGLSRFLDADMGYDVTTVDIENYGHAFERIHYVVNATLYTPDQPFDLVIIDAEHSYESTRANWLHYSAYATKAIMFHDIAGLRDCEGVAQFWYELAYAGDDERHDGFYEAIDDSDMRGGIGWQVL